MSDNDTITLAALIHGEPGAGKSWLGQTAPAPRLILDAEGGSRFAKAVEADGKKRRIKTIAWDPHSDPPPAAGEWEACIVTTRRFETVERVFEWLNIGDHPFRSVVFDSLTEIQARCKDLIRTGDEVMNERMWGILLDRMTDMVRDYRDLTFHPVKPLEAVVFLALTCEKSFKFVPDLQGKLGTRMPGYVDLQGFLAPSVTEDGAYEGRLLIRPHERYQAKDRTDTLSEHYGSVIVNPNVAEMLRVLNEEEDAA